MELSSDLNSLLTNENWSSGDEQLNIGDDMEEFYSSIYNRSIRMRNMTVNDTGKEAACFYEKMPFLTEKFYIITVFGSAVATVGIVNNVILIYILSRRSLAATSIFYLLFLAIFDVFVAVSFLMIFSIQPLFDFTGSVWLYSLWHLYLIPVFTVSHVTMTVSTYLIVAASAERYLVTTLMKTFCMRDRIFIVISVMFFGLFSKGVIYWELEVVHRPNCTGFESIDLRVSPLGRDPLYRALVMVWFRQILHVFMPFVLLLSLNGGIIFRLRRSLHHRSALMELALGVEVSRQRKQTIRAATRMLLGLVATYLLANLFSVVISLWEHVNPSFLEQHKKFYHLSTDVITLLTVVTGAVRLPTYYLCNPQIRKEFHKLLLTKCLHRLCWHYKMVANGKRLKAFSH